MSHALDAHHNTHDDINILSLRCGRRRVLGGFRTSEHHDLAQAIFELGLRILVSVVELKFA